MRRAVAIGGCAAIAVVALASRGTLAAFSNRAEQTGNLVTAADDFAAPTISALAIGKSSGGTTGFVHEAGIYYVYAEVHDSGNPPSGVFLVTADVSNLSTGLTTVPLVSGSYSVGGVTYNFRSAPVTADLTLSEGSKSFSIAATDGASNSGSRSGGVTVDNTAPAGSDVQSANGSGTSGRPDNGDSVTFTFSERVDPESVLAGWDGGSTAVVVRLRNGLAANDDLQVFDSADNSSLPLGTVDLGRSDYVGGAAGGEVLRFDSTMSMSGDTITLTFGSASGSGTAGTAIGSGAMSWSPSSGATDRAGNGASTSAASEGGSADADF